MTLYSQIKGRESHIADLEARTAYLREQGFVVTGRVPVLQDEAIQLLHSEEYDNNPMAARMRTGETLENIVVEVFAPFQNVNLRWNKERREKYNERVRYLGEIVQLNEGFHAHSAFHYTTMEGMTVYFSSIAAAVMGGMFYVEEKTAGRISAPSGEEIIGVFAAIGGIAVANSLMLHYTIDGPLQRKLDRSKDEIHYVDTSLKMRE